MQSDGAMDGGDRERETATAPASKTRETATGVQNQNFFSINGLDRISLLRSNEITEFM
jgi:hypothetical protein